MAGAIGCPTRGGPAGPTGIREGLGSGSEQASSTIRSSICQLSHYGPRARRGVTKHGYSGAFGTQMSRALAVPLLVAAACVAAGDSAPPDSAAIVEIVDHDQDGDPVATDCDDLDPAVTTATERLIPAGPFVRGADDLEDASPARTITLSAYCLDVHEVTNAEFAIFLAEQAAADSPNADAEGRPLFDFLDSDDEVPERIVDAGEGRYTVTPGYEDHPVVEVFHWSALAYCASRGRRVPTEAQWEKAAGGPEEWLWPWGEAEPACERANLRLGPEGSDSGDTTEPCIDDTVPVGSYAESPGAYGQLDLGGNAAEWVFDWYRADYYATSEAEDPVGPDSGWSEQFPDGAGEARVTRGGGFATGDLAATTTSRYVERPGGASNGVGFRCARDLAP